MVYAVSRRLLTAEARDQSWGNPCEVCGGHGGTDTGSSPSVYVFPLSLPSTNAAHLPSSISEWETGESWELPKGMFCLRWRNIGKKSRLLSIFIEIPSLCKIQNSTLTPNFVLLLHMLLKQYISRHFTVFTCEGSSFQTACLHKVVKRAQSVNIHNGTFCLSLPRK
jgi:hypothetical protein